MLRTIASGSLIKWLQTVVGKTKLGIEVLLHRLYLTTDVVYERFTTYCVEFSAVP